MRYALYYTPPDLEREKLALVRRQLCKRFGNRKAVMYPIHLTLVRSIVTDDPKGLTKALKAFLAQQKPIPLRCADRLVTGASWAGVAVDGGARLTRLREGMLEIASAYGEVEPALAEPHISLVYAKRLPQLGSRSSPVKRLMLDQVALCLQTVDETPFRIMMQLPLG